MKYKNLNIISCANGFTLWHYNAKDMDAKNVLEDGFFNPIYDLCTIGDIIIITTDKDTMMRRIKDMGDRIVKLGKLS